MKKQSKYNELRLVAHSKMVTIYFSNEDIEFRRKTFRIFDAYEKKRSTLKSIEEKIDLIEQYIKYAEGQ